MKYTLLKNRVTGERSVVLTDGTRITEATEPARYAELRKRAIRNRHAMARNDVYRFVGVVKTPYGWE